MLLNDHASKSRDSGVRIHLLCAELLTGHGLYRTVRRNQSKYDRPGNFFHGDTFYFYAGLKVNSVCRKYVSNQGTSSHVTSVLKSTFIRHCFSLFSQVFHGVSAVSFMVAIHRVTCYQDNNHSVANSALPFHQIIYITCRNIVVTVL